jgi:hypothetical protein
MFGFFHSPGGESILWDQQLSTDRFRLEPPP